MRQRNFREINLRPIFYRADNLTMVAGHIRLFGRMIFAYHQISDKFELHRVWNFGFFAVHQNAHDAPGWNINFARLTVKREYAGFSVRWRWADTYRVTSK